VLGLYGKAGAGKTSVAKILTEVWPKTWYYPLATPLYDAAYVLYKEWGFQPMYKYEGEFHHLKDEPLRGTENRTPRSILIDLAKTLPTHHLADNFRKKAKRYDKDKTIIVPDIRRPHEAQMIRELGGITIRIVRSSEHGLDEIYEDHDDFSGVFYNEAENLGALKVDVKAFFAPYYDTLKSWGTL